MDVLVPWNNQGKQLKLPELCLKNLSCFPLLSCDRSVFLLFFVVVVVLSLEKCKMTTWCVGLIYHKASVLLIFVGPE